MSLFDILAIVALTIMVGKATRVPGLGGDILVAVICYGFVKWLIMCLMLQRITFDAIPLHYHYIAGGISLFLWAVLLFATIRKRELQDNPGTKNHA